MGWACGICQIWKYVNWMLAYICVRISLIKRASSGPPCCFGVVRLACQYMTEHLSPSPRNARWHPWTPCYVRFSI